MLLKRNPLPSFVLSSLSLLTLSLGHASFAKAGPCEESLKPEVANKICPYYESLKISKDPGDQQSALEIEASLELEETPSADPIPFFTALPRFIADLTGHNGWGNGDQNGRKILLEDHFFKPLPTDFAKLDLKNAFGRTANLSGMNSVCKYVGPKKGAGSQPGIKVECDGVKLKVKFGEIHVQPLASRIFWALGYNVTPSDYHPGISVAYDRRIFDEFNSRVGVPVQIGVGSLALKVAQQNPEYDGMNYMVGGVLKNGIKISAELLDEKYSTEDDDDIAYVITAQAQLQLMPVPGRTTIGMWSYNDLDHWESSAVRAVAVIAAWLGEYDIRRGNNELVLEEIDGKKELKFVFPDLGAGLGRANYKLGFNDSDDADHFRDEIAGGHKIHFAQTNEDNNAFTKATPEDFAVGVKLINQFSRAQIRELLSVSGYQGATLEKFCAKLLSRRDSLNRNF